jgi:hypothetical protein
MNYSFAYIMTWKYYQKNPRGRLPNEDFLMNVLATIGQLCSVRALETNFKNVIRLILTLTGMLRNSEQRPTQMVVVFYHLTLKNHICLPGLVMIDIVDSL